MGKLTCYKNFQGKLHAPCFFLLAILSCDRVIVTRGNATVDGMHNQRWNGLGTNVPRFWRFDPVTAVTKSRCPKFGHRPGQGLVSMGFIGASFAKSWSKPDNLPEVMFPSHEIWHQFHPISACCCRDHGLITQILWLLFLLLLPMLWLFLLSSLLLFYQSLPSFLPSFLPSIHLFICSFITG